MGRRYDVIAFFQNIFILRRAGVAIFADIIKIVTMFNKPALKDSRNVSKWICICIYWYSKIYWFPVKKMLGVCHVIHIVFATSLGKV